MPKDNKEFRHLQTMKPSTFGVLFLFCFAKAKGHSEGKEEECGDGYTCVVSDKYGYGCAPIDDPSHMVCCSAGQEWEDPYPCVQGSRMLAQFCIICLSVI